jgi:hypothetical protein
MCEARGSERVKRVKISETRCKRSVNDTIVTAAVDQVSRKTLKSHKDGA